MSEVLDLNDLVKAVEFTVLGSNYRVPAMNDAKMKKVMGISKEITALSSDEQKESLSEEEEDKLLDLQNTILHEVLVEVQEDDKTKQLPKTKYADWPMKLKTRVLGLIFDQLGSDTVEGETEKN